MFQSKHYLRDEQLPEIREKLLSKIITDLKSKAGIEAIFIGGSLADNTQDLYSDIDLRIVVSEDYYGDFLDSKQQLLSKFGDVLFFEDFTPNGIYTIAHYSNFLKVDLFIYTFSRLSPSIWIQGIKVFLDTTGKLQKIKDDSDMISYKVTKDEVDRWRGKIFAYIHETYRRVMREEYYYALSMMNNLRSFIVSGWNMEVGRHSNSSWDWSKIEGSRSHLEQWQLKLLEDWYCGRDQAQILETLSGVISEFTRIHDVLCNKTGLEKNEARLTQIINLVM